MCPSTPSSWQKFPEFKRNLREWERKKYTKSNHYRYWDLLLISPFCKAVKPPQFQKGIISRSPMASVTMPVQTTWQETCVRQLAACRTVGDKIHPSWSRIHGRIWAPTLFGTACCQLPTKKLGASSGECCINIHSNWVQQWLLLKLLRSGVYIQRFKYSGTILVHTRAWMDSSRKVV